MRLAIAIVAVLSLVVLPEVLVHATRGRSPSSSGYASPGRQRPRSTPVRPASGRRPAVTNNAQKRLSQRTAHLRQRTSELSDSRSASPNRRFSVSSGRTTSSERPTTPAAKRASVERIASSTKGTSGAQGKQAGLFRAVGRTAQFSNHMMRGATLRRPHEDGTLDSARARHSPARQRPGGD